MTGLPPFGTGDKKSRHGETAIQLCAPFALTGTVPMTRRRPSFCPYCGAELTGREFDGRERAFCADCQNFVFQNPVPTGRVVVLDGDRALLVRRDHPPDPGALIVPGGYLEVDESAPVGAARELREETASRSIPTT